MPGSLRSLRLGCSAGRSRPSTHQCRPLLAVRSQKRDLVDSACSRHLSAKTQSVSAIMKRRAAVTDIIPMRPRNGRWRLRSAPSRPLSERPLVKGAVPSDRTPQTSAFHKKAGAPATRAYRAEAGHYASRPVSAARSGWERGRHGRWKISMMFMPPPQHGNGGCRSDGGIGVSINALPARFSRTIKHAHRSARSSGIAPGASAERRSTSAILPPRK